jgi:hypothetical protein
MKWTLLLLLLGLLGCHGQPQAGDKEWAATIADRLYERQILSKTGREELQRRIAAHRLQVEYAVPGTEYEHPHQAVDPATVLAFCAEAFQAEQGYRTGLSGVNSDLYIAGRPPDSAAMRAGQQQFAAALRRAGGDTVAALRQFATPGQLLEEEIKAEDSVKETGWTIYSPLSSSSLPAHCIADSRSIWGKTRTRTARDLYELGLLKEPDYALVKQELASGKLLTEEAVCQRAAELALHQAVLPAQQQVLDSLLHNLHQVGVLTEVGRRRALADEQVRRSAKLFDVLPYCQHAKVFDLHALPRDPARLYPRLLAEVAALWPAFRYTAVLVTPSERDMGDLFDQQIELSFTASGRRYVTSFTQGFRRKDGQDPDPATGVRISKDFIAGINQWLRDQQAPERLYVAYTPSARSVYGDERQGLIMLTPKQRSAWGDESYFLQTIDDEVAQAGAVVPADKFTSGYIEDALALYQRIGLFEGLTNAEIAAGRREAHGGKVGSYEQVLRGFPRVLVATGGEEAEMPQAYANALREVAAVTRGAFRPTHIRDTFTGHEARNQASTLSFDCGARHYRARLVSDLGWMDFGFLPLVERAVRETTQGGRLYILLADEASVYVFLTAPQAAALRKAQPDFFAVADEADAPAPTTQTLGEKPLF